MGERGHNVASKLAWRLRAGGSEALPLPGEGETTRTSTPPEGFEDVGMVAEAIISAVLVGAGIGVTGRKVLGLPAGRKDGTPLARVLAPLVIAVVTGAGAGRCLLRVRRAIG